MSHHIHKKRLLQRLRELGQRIETIEAELQAPHSKDWDDMAIEREGDEVLDRLGAAGQSEVARITCALKRMSAGTYGICVSCGEPISESRLDSLPDTPLCRECAAVQK